MKYVNFNDEKLPIGIRKQAYVKWAVSKGTGMMDAKKQANKKFGFELKPGLLAIVFDGFRMGQKSFRVSEIFDGYDLRKYKEAKYIIIGDNEVEIEQAIKKAKTNGWDVVKVNLIA